jgi:hypothetical protein
MSGLPLTASNSRPRNYSLFPINIDPNTPAACVLRVVRFWGHLGLSLQNHLDPQLEREVFAFGYVRSRSAFRVSLLFVELAAEHGRRDHSDHRCERTPRLSPSDRLQALWPGLTAMEYRDDLQPLTAQSIRDNIRCPWNHELPRPGHPTGTPEIRQQRQAVDCSGQCRRRTARRAGVLAGNTGSKVNEMADRPRRPDDSHARGAFRSRFLPHDRSHFDTSSCATPRPLSSSWRPA